MKKVIISIAIIVIAAAIIFALLQTEEEEIKIGSISILTGGPIADAGIASKNGIDLAIETINSQGGLLGKKLRAIHEDEQGDVQKTISAFQKLTAIDDVKVIIGTTWSNTGLALVDLAKENEVLMISPSLGVAEFNEASKFIFNTRPHDFILSSRMADYVYEKGHRKVAIIGAQQVWVKEQTDTFRERFEELGGEALVMVEPNPEDTVVNVEALKIKDREKELDAIISTTDGVLVGVIMAKKVRELGVSLPMYSVIMTPDTIKAADGAYEGTEILTFFDPSLEFQARYEERFRTEADITSDSAYDAMMLIARAIEQTGSTDTNVLQEYLNQVKEYDGASGFLTSDGKGGFTRDYIVQKVINGVATKIE